MIGSFSLHHASEPWPPDLKAALDATAAGQSGAGSFSMPVAELWTSWSFTEAVRDHAVRGGPTVAVICVTYCRPAAAALNKEKSKSRPMAAILRSMRESIDLWLGVWVPRRFNTDADVTSHPSEAANFIQSARQLGFQRVVHLSFPERCWRVLREAVL